MITPPLLLLGEQSKFGSRSLTETHFQLFRINRIEPLQYELQYQTNISIISLVFPKYKGPKFIRRIRLIRKLVKRFSSFQNLKKYDKLQKRMMYKMCGQIDETPQLTFKNWTIEELWRNYNDHNG